MLRFIDKHGMAPALVDFARTRPVWGICAGAILTARKVVNPDQPSLGLIDIQAHRNFYGSQLDSFTTSLSVEFLGEKTVEAHFIRAPLLAPLDATTGRPPVVVQAAIHNQSVFLTQGNVWVTSFHVELGRDSTLHERFLALGDT
jgi:5'-phosphate synthase pdxT subunit